VNARWPQRLWIVRHGQSAGNLARAIAVGAGAHRIDIAERDVDVPLSLQGEEQAQALGRWFADMPPQGRPQTVLTSPYKRARDTAAAVAKAGGLACAGARLCIDERLREREFGILDRLTDSGVREFHPDQAQMRAQIGKFYHRPPGGESWCDVILRLRTLLDTISLHHAQERVLIVCHQVVILCLRYLLEGMDEAAVLAVSAETNVANCSVTEYAFDPAAPAMSLVRFNFIAPLERSGAPVTAEPDTSAAPR
jgi:probable phosphoglycerate mutase